MKSELLNVSGCGRCGGIHTELSFVPFINPILIGPVKRTHWALCPATGEPLMMHIRPTGEMQHHCCYIHPNGKPCGQAAQFVATWGQMETDYSEGCGAHVFALVDGGAEADKVYISIMD